MLFNYITNNTSPPPPETLLDGFESLSGSNPWTSSGYEWHEFDGLALSVTRTTSNVTQGTYSWRIQDGSFPVGGLHGIITGLLAGAAILDLSSYTELQIDCFGASLGGAVSAYMVLYSADASQTIEIFSAGGLSGADTLTLDLTTAPFSLTDVNLFIGVGSGGAVGTYDIYFDNLRAS